MKSPPGATESCVSPGHAVEPIVEPHAVPVHGARQIDAVVKAHRDRRVLRHANERAGHLAVEAVHRERVALDRSADEHRREIERVAVLETRDLRRLRRGKLPGIDASPGRNGATGGASPTSPGIIGMPFGIGTGIGMSIAIVSRIAAGRAAGASPSTHPASWPASSPSPACLASCRLCRRLGRRLRRSACRGARDESTIEQPLRPSHHGGIPRKSGCDRNDCSHPLGDVPCSTVGPACVVGVAIDSAVMTSRNLLSSAWPTVFWPFVIAPSRSHCLRSVVTAQATYARVRAERRRLRETGRVDLHVVARAAVGGHGDAERRRREHEARLSLGVRRLGRVEQRNVERSGRRGGDRRHEASPRQPSHRRPASRGQSCGTTAFTVLSGPWS